MTRDDAPQWIRRNGLPDFDRRYPPHGRTWLQYKPPEVGIYTLNARLAILTQAGNSYTALYLPAGGFKEVGR